MKLYKGDRVMQMVDKDQVDDCINAGWSRTKPEVEKDSLSENSDLSEEELEDKKMATPKKKKIVLKKTKTKK